MPIRRTIIHTDKLFPHQIDALGQIGCLEPRADYQLLLHELPVDTATLCAQLQCDVNTLPLEFEPARVRLLISDLDSTLISIETIDEIAAEVGLKDQVARITEKAMTGELDFIAALEERVGLLEGLPTAMLEKVFEHKMKPAIQPGATSTLVWLKQRNVVTAVVSGGFTFFTDRLQEILPIDHARACELEIKGGHLTGRLQGTIVDKHAKVEFLQELTRRLDIDPSQVVAIGDGANDVPMLERAGLGVAYHGHAIASRHADVRIDSGDWLELRHLLLDLQGS